MNTRRPQRFAVVAGSNPLQVPKANLLRLRNGDNGVSAIDKPDASPWWKLLLPPQAGPHDQFFGIAPGAEVSIYCECPTDSMIRFLWTRSVVARAIPSVPKRYFLSATSVLEDDDIDEERNTWDYLGDISMRIVFDSLDSKVVMDWTPLDLIQGNDEFGRVVMPSLTPKTSVISFQFRNTVQQVLYVSTMLHGWRIRL